MYNFKGSQEGVVSAACMYFNPSRWKGNGDLRRPPVDKVNKLINQPLQSSYIIFTLAGRFCQQRQKACPFAKGIMQLISVLEVCLLSRVSQQSACPPSLLYAST